MSDSTFEARVSAVDDGVVVELHGTVNRAAKEALEDARG